MQSFPMTDGSGKAKVINHPVGGDFLPETFPPAQAAVAAM